MLPAGCLFEVSVISVQGMKGEDRRKGAKGSGKEAPRLAAAAAYSALNPLEK